MAIFVVLFVYALPDTMDSSTEFESQIVDRLSIFEDVVPLDLIMTSEAIAAMKIYEKTVEVVGFVGSRETKHDMFKFILSNNHGQNIQVIAWDVEAAKARTIVIPNSIAHIDAAFVKPRHNLSQGNTPFDLTIASNTIINILQKLDRVEMVAPDPTEVCSIEDAVNHTEEIALEGFIRNAIQVVSLPFDTKISQGCITDGKFKLELRLPDATEIVDFKVGDHVRVIGKIRYTHLPHLLVQKKEDITLASPSKLSLIEIFKGNDVPKRKCPREEKVQVKRTKT